MRIIGAEWKRVNTVKYEERKRDGYNLLRKEDII
jgi:hypothetical protein